MAAFTMAQLLQIAHCTVIPARESHFQTVQQDIWGSGMKRAGMSAGLFARTAEQPEYLVASAWPTVAQHTQYRAKPFYPLRKAAQVEADVTVLSGVLVNLTPQWAVRGTLPNLQQGK
ncbi:MAG: hypothetical protein GY796_34225 [Chloroflexi bacterium]|nr:hypothetical protein [Chloroflexota bacterium]